MTPSAELVVTTFKYYAVYESGRSCEVSLEDVQKYGDNWEANEGVQILTVMFRKVAPTYGHVSVVTL